MINDEKFKIFVETKSFIFRRIFILSGKKLSLSVKGMHKQICPNKMKTKLIMKMYNVISKKTKNECLVI